MVHDRVIAAAAAVLALAMLAPSWAAGPDTQPAAQMPADPVDNLMGDYSGTLSPRQGEPVPAAAKVAPWGKGEYRVLLSADGLAEPIVVSAQKAKGDVLVGEGFDVTDGKLTAATPAGRFALTRVIKRSPTLGDPPPAGAVVLLPYEAGKPTNLDAWTNKKWLVLPDGSVEVRGGTGKTLAKFGDCKLHVEFRTPYMPTARGQGRGNSGVYLQERYEVQVLDSFGQPPRDNEAGGIYKVSTPKVNASLPPLSWQTYDIEFRAPRLDAAGKVTEPAEITVVYNGQLIHDKVKLRNQTGGGAGGAAASAAIMLQDHGNPVRYRNIWLVETGGPASSRPDEAAGVSLLDAELSQWTCKPGSWAVEDGVLARKGGGDIWTRGQYGDFVLELEFKMSKGANSGVFFRTANTRDPVQTGIEMQVYDTFGKPPSRNSCGAIYDCAAPGVSAEKPAGEWNHVRLTCKGPDITVVLNGKQIVQMNLDHWTEPHKNPDGSRNKFNRAYKDMARTGYIGFQDHGSAVWYRNVRLTPLP